MNYLRQRTWCRVTSLLTAMVFLWTSTAGAWVGNLRGRVGAPHRSVLNGKACALEDSFKELLPEELSAIHIPTPLGHVEERFTGKDPRFVLIVQDIHANYEAQQNISQIMQFWRLERPKEISRY